MGKTLVNLKLYWPKFKVSFTRQSIAFIPKENESIETLYTYFVYQGPGYCLLCRFYSNI